MPASELLRLAESYVFPEGKEATGSLLLSSALFASVVVANQLKKYRKKALRIILVGQQQFCADVLQAYLDMGQEIVAVYTLPDTAERPEAARVLAAKHGIPCYQPVSYKTEEVKKTWESLKPDLAVFAYVTKIIPESVIKIPKLGTICFHPSLLPKYRGGSAIQWQIISGETETGVTVFWTDAGTDTGPILLQKKASIKPTDTTASLYFKTLYSLGIAAMKESLELILAGKAPKLPQNEALASAQPLCKDKHALIDWTRPGQEIYNLIRGCNPQPGAYTVFPGKFLKVVTQPGSFKTVNGKRLRIYDCELVNTPDSRAGLVSEVTQDSFTIGCGDKTSIKIKRVLIEGEKKKILVQALLSTAPISVGDSFL